MSEYLVLIYDHDSAWAELSPAETGRMHELHEAYPGRVEELGAKVLGGNALQSVSTATTIRGGEVTDGPFAETEESLGGYYLIEAPDLDVALAAGKACPVVAGSIEVRPIMVIR